MPKDFRYAVEIRNSGLLGPEYRKVLASHEVALVYNRSEGNAPLTIQVLMKALQG